MATTIRDATTGQRLVIQDDGSVIPAPEAGILAQAGRQFADIGSGLQMAAGTVLDRPDWVAQAEADTAERNRLFAGTDLADPITSMVGQALPGAATFPITGLAAGVALGAGESALDVGQGGSALDRAQGGALGAIGGEIAGRVLGRVMNLGEGLSQALAGRRLDANPEALAAEAAGLETAAYQRMTPDTLGQSFADRVTQGVETSIWGAPRLKAMRARNDLVYNQAAADAIGVPLPARGTLDKAWRRRAEERFQVGFAEVAAITQGKGNIPVGGALRNVLEGSEAIRKLQRFGNFAFLKREGDTFMTGREWLLARQAIAEEAAQEANSAVQGRMYSLLDELDSAMERRLGQTEGPAFTDLFSKLREQYRVYLQLEKPNVIGTDGNINVKALNRNLRNRSSGFGRTATSGIRETVNPETQSLIDLAEVGDQTLFAPFKSSGTAERQALREFTDDVGDIATGGPEGMIRGVLSQGAPLVTPIMEAGGGLPYDYLLNRPGMPIGGMIGRGYGRGAMDETFYPFVGAEDDRRQ